MVRILQLPEKKFIESQRKLGVSCQTISEKLGVQICLVYKWTTRCRPNLTDYHCALRLIFYQYGLAF